MVEQNGHSMAVLISPDLFQKMMALEEDAAWAEKALEAERSGYAGTDGMQQLFNLAREKNLDLQAWLIE